MKTYTQNEARMIVAEIKKSHEPEGITGWGRFAGDLQFFMMELLQGGSAYSESEFEKYLEMARTRQEVKEVMHETV